MRRAAFLCRISRKSQPTTAIDPMARRDDQLIDIAATIRGETPKALRLFDGTKTEWCPKQFVEDNKDGTFTMPEWLAKEKGFI
jgi:hypothetical protein